MLEAIGTIGLMACLQGLPYTWHYDHSHFHFSLETYRVYCCATEPNEGIQFVGRSWNDVVALEVVGVA